MKVELARLKRNESRDFNVDPIDPNAVAQLKASIQESGFWGGVVCRRRADGDIEVVAGEHRIAAAKAAGMTHADLHVMEETDDAKAIRIYAGENATQRGNLGTALTGTIAASVKYLVKQAVAGAYDASISNLYKELISKGIGRTSIKNLLHGIPGITENSILDQLANLKASGDYDRIIKEVCGELKEDEDEEVVEKAVEVEERTARKSKPRAFDLKGVSKHFKVPKHVVAFRTLVTSQNIKEFLPVDKQASLAKAIVASAKESGRDLTVAFIKSETLNRIHKAKELTPKEKEEMRKRALVERVKDSMHDFCRQLGAARKIAKELEEIYNNEWPKDVPFPITDEFRYAIVDVFPVVQNLYRRFTNEHGNSEGKRGGERERAVGVLR